MKISLKDLYIEFFKLGLQLLGGGYVILPLMQKSLIEKKHWITSEELTDFYAISQSIPGIIAANISTFVGYKLRGKTGAMIAIVGVTTTPIISILLVALILEQILRFTFIQSIFWGVGISVIILIYLSIKEMWQHSVKDFIGWVIFLGTFLASFLFKISPATVIIGAVIFGVAYKIIQRRFL